MEIDTEPALRDPMATFSSSLKLDDRLGAVMPAFARAPYALSMVDTMQARVAVWQSRSHGLPLVFLHTGSMSKDSFAAQFHGPLRHEHRLMAIDLPGHGASGDAHDPATAYTLDGYADTVVEVLEHFDLDQAVLVGWGLGGHVALNVLARYPGIVGALLIATPPLGNGAHETCAIHPAGIHPATTLLGLDCLDDAQVARLAEAIVGPGLADLAMPAIRRTDSATRVAMAASLASGDFEDERRIARTAQAPIAIVYGDEDPLVDADILEGCELGNPWEHGVHALPGGHAPFIDAPHMFDELLGRFAHDMSARAADLRANPTLAFGG